MLFWVLVISWVLVSVHKLLIVYLFLCQFCSFEKPSSKLVEDDL
jgi:hypothetical protein